MTLTQQKFSVLGQAEVAGASAGCPAGASSQGLRVAAGIVATSKLWFPIIARADDDDEALVAPRPIPQTVAPGAPFHVVLPAPGTEPATITDFQGRIGLADLGGTGVGFSSGQTETLLHAADVRFMKGKYIGVDNRRHEAAVVFV